MSLEIVFAAAGFFGLVLTWLALPATPRATATREVEATVPERGLATA
jgi:hypothetical protein